MPFYPKFETKPIKTTSQLQERKVMKYPMTIYLRFHEIWSVIPFTNDMPNPQATIITQVSEVATPGGLLVSKYQSLLGETTKRKTWKSNECYNYNNNKLIKGYVNKCRPNIYKSKSHNIPLYILYGQSIGKKRIQDHWVRFMWGSLLHCYNSIPSK